MKYGPSMVRDIVELMNHARVDRAHVHGFSLGGALITHLLADYPGRLITASYGGVGIPEVDASWKARVPEDVEFDDPRERELFTWDGRTDIDREALNAMCAGSAGTGERALRVSVDAALRAGIFKASGSFDPMGFWDERER